MNDNMIRIQKIMADSGYCSRRKAEELISAGLVTVDGRVASLGDKANPYRQIIAIDGERLVVEKRRALYYIALHKPRGYVTTMSDEQGRRCVAELVQDVPARVFPVGRLDRNSEGLLIMTNDGEFANLLMHPSHGIGKTYRVTIPSLITDGQLVKLAEGVELDGRKTAPATVRVISKESGRTVCEITIYEGRNRQIRRMCEALGLEVARLKRISEGSVRLGYLQPGKWRELTKEEIQGMRNLAQKAIASRRHEVNAERKSHNPYRTRREKTR